MLNSSTPRRAFLGGAIAAAGVAALPACARAAKDQIPSDAWMDEVPGEHRCLFDFNQHKNGATLLHILNYLNTYSTAYDKSSGEVGAAATLYGINPGSSIALGFDDEIWEKYELGAYHQLLDADGQAYTRNVFWQPESSDAHLLALGTGIEPIAPFLGAMPALGIQSLQGMGTKFIMCNNALNAWSFELASRGKGEQEEINAELRAHLLPGVSIVPAMVIAIELAQEAGIRYNKQ